MKTKEVYLNYIKFIMNFSKDITEINDIYRSSKVSLDSIKSVSSKDSKLISFGVFMIVGVPEPIISDAIGFIFLGLGSVFVKKKDLGTFILDEFNNVRKELKFLYDTFFIDHYI